MPNRSSRFRISVLLRDPRSAGRGFRPRVREVVPRTPVAVRAVDARSPRDHGLMLGTEAVLPSDTEPHLTRLTTCRASY